MIEKGVKICKQKLQQYIYIHDEKHKNNNNYKLNRYIIKKE